MGWTRRNNSRKYNAVTEFSSKPDVLQGRKAMNGTCDCRHHGPIRHPRELYSAASGRPITALTSGITFSAISSIDRIPSDLSSQSLPA